MPDEIKIECDNDAMRDVHQEIHDSNEMEKVHLMSN